MTTHHTTTHYDDGTTADDYPHDWQRSRITGTVTCSGCHLLPLDDDDTATPCPATAVSVLSDELAAYPHDELAGVWLSEYDPYDPWGSALSCQFAVAAVLTMAGYGTPDNWQYRPSPGAVLSPVVALSSGHYSHDMQVSDALSFMADHHPHEHAAIIAAHPELGRLVWYGSWVDTDAMGANPDLMSWVADSVEQSQCVWWSDGEPYAYDPDADHTTVLVWSALEWSDDPDAFAESLVTFGYLLARLVSAADAAGMSH